MGGGDLTAPCLASGTQPEPLSYLPAHPALLCLQCKGLIWVTLPPFTSSPRSLFTLPWSKLTMTEPPGPPSPHPELGVGVGKRESCPPHLVPVSEAPAQDLLWRQQQGPHGLVMLNGSLMVSERCSQGPWQQGLWPCPRPWTVAHRGCRRPQGV